MSNEISRIRVKFIAEGVGEAFGELHRTYSPRTVEAITRKLPLEGRAALWGDEVYFEVPVTLGSEKPRSTVSLGTIAYWPRGAALCIFFGKTQPYSPVNVVGEIVENLELFSKVKSSTRIRVERA